MKAEKVIGIAACAFACVTSSAFANSTTNWFGAVGSGNTIVLTEATTNGVDVSVSDGVITLDGDTELTFTPTDANPARSDNLVTIESSAVLTPNAVSDLPASGDLGGAQVGFAIAYDGAATNYYCYASGAWGACDGTPPADPTQSVTFKITLDYRTHRATFKVGDAVVSNNVAFVTSGAAKLSSVAARGSGSLTEVSAKYEIAVAEYSGTKYGSIDEAVTAAGDSAASVVTYNESGAAEASTAENGMPTWVCKALDIATNDGEATPAVVPSGADTSMSAITLKLNYDPTRDGAAKAAGVLKFKVGDGAAQNSDNIQIPLVGASGNYQIKVVY